MDTALLVGLSRQMAARRTMDVIANNLANMTTTSFKSESVLFGEHIVEVTNDSGDTEQIAMVLDRGVSLDFAEGRMDPTGNPLDVAISGDGFFVVETSDGEQYTRNGHWGTDDEGRLVTTEGNPILTVDGGYITLSPEDGVPEIAHDGTITTANGAVNEQIQVVRFNRADGLAKVGNSMYETEATPLPAEEASILQGNIETSNVVPILEMTRMIDVTRMYTSISKMIETSDQLTRDTIRRLAETNA